MGRSPGLSESERRELLARIESLLGESPKGKLVKAMVKELPAAENGAAEGRRPARPDAS